MTHLIKYTLLLFLAFLSLSRAIAYDTTGYTPLTGSGKNIGGTNKYLIPSGQSWSGGITANNHETLSLIVEGTATVSWVSLASNSNFEIIVGTTGSINYSSFSSEVYYTLINYSNALTLTNIGGTLINYGTITGNPSFQVYDKGALENYGTVNTTNLEVTEMLKNYGTINVSGQLQVDNTATLENSCMIIVKGNFINDNDLIMREGAFMEVQLKTTFYASSSMTFEKDAYLKTKDVWTWGHQITGPSLGHALFQYFGTLTGNMPDFASYNIYFVDSEGNMNGTPVNFSIASNSCNPGFGVVPDADHDGVPDSQDEFPEDATRAFISYYPAGGTTWNTLMFEDQWPNLGDYDFNDLVIKYQYEFYSNADNEVVDLVAHFKVVASGASYANGFGFKLNIPNSSVLDVSGYVHSGTSIALNTNKTEQGSSDEAVIIVYDNINTSLEGTFINVRRDGTTKEIDPIIVHVSLNKVQNIGSSTINPFIYVDQVRGREVHLMNYTPTSKADNSYFGTGDDDSDSGTYYRSAQGYPWCLDVPADVRHMLETFDFTIGYPDFVKWANSGGTQYLDWYRTNLYTPALY